MIFFQKFKTMYYVVASREFVILSYRHKEEKFQYFVGQSVDYEKALGKGAVKGDLKIGGWILEEKEGVKIY